MSSHWRAGRPGRRPAEMDDRDRRGLTALPTDRWRCLVCGRVTFHSESHYCPVTPEPEPPMVRPSTLRAAAVWLRLALFTTLALEVVILTVYAIHGAATWTN